MGNVVILRGLGSNTICSTLQILANVLISERSYEILFHVVLDNYIKYDALIGRDILSQGVGVTITSKSLTMFNEKSILSVEVSEKNPDLAHVDFLSRNPVPKIVKNSIGVVERHINLTETSDNWLLAEQQRDEETSSIISKLRNNELSEDLAKTYELRSGTLYRKIQRNGKTRCLPIIPKQFRWSAVNNVHESVMHLGWEKTLEKMYEFYWFDKMSKYVR